MNRMVFIFKSGIAAYCILFIISCNDSTIDEQVLSPLKITIPTELKQISEIEKFVTKTESQINHLSEETKILIAEYRQISNNKTKKDNLMEEVKKVTINGRINSDFVHLSEIYSKIDLQSSVLKNQLTGKQMDALNLITNKFKTRIDELMILYRSFQKEQKLTNKFLIKNKNQQS
jgi:hypothetical protein